jgi:hypothetical protein
MNWIFRLFFMLFAGAVLVLLFAFALVGLTLSFLRWLITGQKPDIAIAFNTVRQWRQQPFARNAFEPDTNDVIDAQVREVHPSKIQQPQIEDKR